MAFRAPNVGEWFVDKTIGQLFEIVAIDERTQNVEVQYIDGELSEYDLDSWVRLDIEVASAPEDWSASYEIAPEDRDDHVYLDHANDPLDFIEADLFVGTDEIY